MSDASTAPAPPPYPHLAKLAVRLDDGSEGTVEVYYGPRDDPCCIVARPDGLPAVTRRWSQLTPLALREPPPARREHDTLEFEYGPEGQAFKFTLRAGRDPATGRVIEIFVVDESRRQSQLNELLADGAISISHALQRGASVAELAHALARDDGSAASPLGEALRLLARELAAETARKPAPQEERP